MGTAEVLENGGVGDGYGINSCNDDAYAGTMVGGSQRIVNGVKVSEELGDEILEQMESYWEDINGRLTVSRMVSDSLMKGILSAVEQDAAERIMAKEMELAKLKESLQFHDNGGLSKTESFGSSSDELESLTFQKHFALSDVYPEHDRMRETLGGLRYSAVDQFKKLKKGIDRVRGGSSSMRKMGSGSELVGLGGILQEQECESWVRVDKTLKNLKTTMDTIFTVLDEAVQPSKMSIAQWQEEHLIESDVEAMVMRSLIRGLHESFEDKLLDQYTQSCSAQVDKLNEISGLRKDLDVILKSLSSKETGCLTSHDVTSSKSFLEGNEKLEGSKTDIPEKFEAASLKHLSREGIVEYFNNMIAKMKRDHESIMEKKTDDYFALRAEYLTLLGRGSVVPHKDHSEFHFLREKIPQVISKLDDIFVETEKCHECAKKAASLYNLTDTIDSLLSENRQLRDSLRDLKNEVRFLSSKVADAAEESRQHSVAEANMEKRIGDLNVMVEDSKIAASVRDEVYVCFLRDLISKKGSEADELNVEFHITSEIYDIILREAYINTENSSESENEDLELELMITQDVYRVISIEAIKDAQDKLKELYRDYLHENELRAFFAIMAMQRKDELVLLVEEKEKLKQTIYQLERSADEKQTLVSKSNTELDGVKGQLAEALEQIKVLKEGTNQLNQKLERKAEELKEADDKAKKMFLTVCEERQNILALNETKENELRKQMQTVICTAHGLSKMLAVFESRVSSSLEANQARLENSSFQLNSLVKKTSSLKKTVVLYRQRLDKRFSDLQMAEAEVDLLGDEVDTLLSLLEKIYIALDHYSPVLQHYPGVIEILKLIRKELSGDSTMLVK